MATFADDTAILASDDIPLVERVQDHLRKLEPWLDKWRMKINEQKSTHITFTLRKSTSPPVLINNKEIPQTDVAKYLGILS